MRVLGAVLGALVLSACAATADPQGAAQGPPESDGFLRASSADGTHTLRMIPVGWRDSWDGEPAMLVQYQATVENKGPDTLLERANPLTRAVTPDGVQHELAITDYTVHVATGNLAITYLRLPLGTELVSELEFRCVLVHVTQWKELRFTGLGPGESAPLHCGPFELWVGGEPGRFVVGAGAMAEFEAEHRSFSERVPIEGLHHRWALQAVQVQDANGRQLFNMGGGGSGGVSVGHFYPEMMGAPGASVEPEIAYPVSVSLRVPLVFEREEVRFLFRDVPVPRRMPE
jgi:hypothetical protein